MEAATATTVILPRRSTLRAACINLDCAPSGVHLKDYAGQIITNPVVYLVNFTETAGSISPAGVFAPNLDGNISPSGSGAALAALVAPCQSWLGEYMRGSDLSSARFGGVATLTHTSLADSAAIPNNATIGARINAYFSGARFGNTLPIPSDAIFILSLRLITAVCVEQHDEWIASERRYRSEQSMARLADTTPEINPEAGPPTLMA